MDLAQYYNSTPVKKEEIRVRATLGLYVRVMTTLMKVHKPVPSDIDKAVTDMSLNIYQKADYNNIKVRMARLIKMSPTFSELACKHMSSLLSNWTINFQCQELNIVCIFDGPGDYAIGCMNAMFEKRMLPKHMNVTMVNKHTELNMMFSVIITEEQSFLRNTPLSTFLNSVDFNYNSITAEVLKSTQDNGKEVIGAVSNADITVAIDILNEGKENGLHTLEEIAGSVKDGALLFLGNHVNLGDTEILEASLGTSFQRIYFETEIARIPPARKIKDFTPMAACYGSAGVFRKIVPTSNS